MDVTERNRGDRRRLARLITKESNAIQRDRLRSVLLALQGRETLEIAGVAGRIEPSYSVGRTCIVTVGSRRCVDARHQAARDG